MSFSGSARFQLKEVKLISDQAAPTKSTKKQALQGPAITKKALMSFAGLKLGTHLFTLNLSKLQKRLLSYPQVKSVQLKRMFPHTLEIRIKTHRPAAVVSMGGLYFLNRRGLPFARLNDAKEAKGFLRLSGIRREEYEQKPESTQQLFRQALALAQLYRKRKLMRYQPLREIQFDPILGYVLRTDAGSIYLGTKGFPERLKQLQRIYKLFWQRGVRQLRYVYLNHRRHPRRAVVRVGDAVLVHQSANKPKKKGRLLKARMDH